MKRLALLAALLLGATPTWAAQYEVLLSQSEAEQARILGIGITSAGYPCPRVTKILFKGPDEDEAGYWAAACSDGGNWMVQIRNDAGGTMSTTPCSTLEQLGIKCWEKF